MSVRNCIEKLAAAGQISRRIADQALALEGGLQLKFGAQAGPTAAEAAAALETARLMADAAKSRKLSIAKQAIAFERAQQVQATLKENGPVAGLMSGFFARDLWGRGGVNVSTQTEVIEAQLFRHFNDGMEALRSRAVGFVQDVAGARDLVRELFGEATGSDVAKAAADGWRRATDAAVTRAKAAGRMVAALEDWRLPQFWTSERIRGRKDAWFRDVQAEIERGGLVLWDKETRARKSTATGGDPRRGIQFHHGGRRIRRWRVVQQ